MVNVARMAHLLTDFGDELNEIIYHWQNAEMKRQATEIYLIPGNNANKEELTHQRKHH